MRDWFCPECDKHIKSHSNEAFSWSEHDDNCSFRKKGCVCYECGKHIGGLSHVFSNEHSDTCSYKFTKCVYSLGNHGTFTIVKEHAPCCSQNPQNNIESC